MSETTVEDIELKLKNLAERLVWFHESLGDIFTTFGDIIDHEITREEGINRLRAINNKMRES